MIPLLASASGIPPIPSHSIHNDAGRYLRLFVAFMYHTYKQNYLYFLLLVVRPINASTSVLTNPPDPSHFLRSNWSTRS